MTRSLRIVTSVLPALGLLALAEIGVRIGDRTQPTRESVAIPNESRLLRSSARFRYLDLRPARAILSQIGAEST